MQGCLWLVEIHSPSFQGALKRALEPVRTLLQGHGGGLELYRDNGKDNGNHNNVLGLYRNILVYMGRLDG